MTPYQHASRAVAFCLPIMLLMVLGGCSGCGGEGSGRGGRTGPVQYSDEKGSLDCRVTVHAGIYTGSDTGPTVDVYWDGRKVFSGEMPYDDVVDHSNPVSFIEITTSHGPHVLEFRSGDFHKKQDVNLGDKETRHYLITEDKSRTGLLIRDLGPNPMFR